MTNQSTIDKLIEMRFTAIQKELGDSKESFEKASKEEADSKKALDIAEMDYEYKSYSAARGGYAGDEALEKMRKELEAAKEELSNLEKSKAEAQAAMDIAKEELDKAIADGVSVDEKQKAYDEAVAFMESVSEEYDGLKEQVETLQIEYDMSKKPKDLEIAEEELEAAKKFYGEKAALLEEKKAIMNQIKRI